MHGCKTTKKIPLSIPSAPDMSYRHICSPLEGCLQFLDVTVPVAKARQNSVLLRGGVIVKAGPSNWKNRYIYNSNTLLLFTRDRKNQYIEIMHIKPFLALFAGQNSFSVPSAPIYFCFKTF